MCITNDDDYELLHGDNFADHRYSKLTPPASGPKSFFCLDLHLILSAMIPYKPYISCSIHEDIEFYENE